MANKLIVEVIGDTRSYEKAMGRSSKATKTFATNVGTLSSKTKVGFGTLLKGAAVFTGLTVGIRGVSNAITGSIRASTDFQASLTKMIGLSGVASSAIGGLRQDVLRLAPQVGKGPKELAEALFFITSSGIDAAHAMDVLAVSAKASAAGLGETQVVADAVTSAINAYGKENITATQATDVLVATVREGKGEASEFAGVIGNVAAIAGELGVSFDEVGASLAAMTRLGTDSQTAAIQLQQVFSALLNTSPKVAKAFDSVGLSLDDTRKQISQPGGFLPALRKIKDAFGTNTVALRQAFPEIRAFRGVIALVGKQSAPVAGIFDRLAKSTGSLKTAFGAITQTQAQQFAKLNASIEVFRITLGSALAPAILDVVQPLNKWLSVTKNQETVQRKIRETVKTVVGVIREFVAVMKPLVSAAIGAVKALGGMQNVLKLLIPLFVATKIVSFTGALTGLTAEAITAKGAMVALRTAMLRLSAIGVVVLSIEFVTNYDKISGQFVSLLEKAHLLHKTKVAPPPGELVRLRDQLKKVEIHFGRNSQRARELREQLENLTGDAESTLANLIKRLDTAEKFFGANSDQAKTLRAQIKALRIELAKLNGTFKAAGAEAAGFAAVSAAITATSIAARGGDKTTTTKRQTGGDELTAKELAKPFRKKAADAAKSAFEKAVALLDIQAQIATRTKSLQDDLAVQKQIEKVIRARLAVTKDDVDLQRQLVDVQNQQLDIQKQITENRKAAKTAAQFKELGLTAEGNRPTPGAGSLLKKATGLQNQVKGTVLDTKKNRSELKKIVAFLKKHFKDAGQEVRAAILGMLNDISGALKGGDKALDGPLTKTHALNTNKIVAGLGLSPEEERAVRLRLANVNSAGRKFGGNRTNAPGASKVPGQRGPSEIVVQSNITVNLDGQRIANVVTRNQQKSKRRNPKQKRGPHRGD